MRMCTEYQLFAYMPLVSEIAEMLDKGRTAIKAALNELDAAGLLVRERQGKLRRQEIEIYYSFVGKVELPD